MACIDVPVRYAEHRDKLHGTLSTFDAVDKKVRGNGVGIYLLELSGEVDLPVSQNLS